MQSAVDAEALLPKMASTAKTMRANANDYASPFRTDARDAADTLDVMATALQQQDAGGFEQAANRYNQIVDRTNADCDKARH